MLCARARCVVGVVCDVCIVRGMVLCVMWCMMYVRGVWCMVGCVCVVDGWCVLCCVLCCVVL